MINQFIRNFCLKGCKNIKKYRIVLGFELGVGLIEVSCSKFNYFEYRISTQHSKLKTQNLKALQPAHQGPGFLLSP